MTLRRLWHPLWLSLWALPLALSLWAHLEFAASWQMTAQTPAWERAGRVLLALLRDCLYLGAVLGALHLASGRGWPLRLLLRGAALGLVAVVLGDALIALRSYGVRLQWDESLPYISLSGIAGYLGVSILGALGVLALQALGALLVLLPRGPRGLGRGVWGWTAAALLAVGAAAHGVRVQHDWALQAAPVAWGLRSVDRGYGADFAAMDPERAAQPVRCLPFALPEHSRPRNVLVVVLESFSASHLASITGEDSLNLGPNFDRWSKRGRLFTNFRANGYATVSGLLPLLTGNIPATPPRATPHPRRMPIQRHDSLHGPDALLPLARRHGWHTLFAMPGDGHFSDKKRWIQDLGIGSFEMRADSDFYRDWPSFIFDGAPDGALYRRWLRDMERQPQPYIAFLETMSSHFPYINPEDPADSGDITAPFRYADRQLGWFLDRLDERGYLEDNLVVVVSDHYWLTTQVPNLLPASGPGGARDYAQLAHVPLLLLGKGVEPGVEARRFQQTDLYNGLRGLVSGRSCTHRAMGDVFAQPPQCTLHAIGTERDALFVECGRPRRFARLLLDAEDSRFEPAGVLGRQHEEWLLRWVHAWRHRQQHDADSFPHRQP